MVDHNGRGYAVAIRSRFLHIAKPLFSDKIPARSFRVGYPPAPHAEHVDHRPCRALKRATLHREPPLLSSAQPTCLRTLTGLSLRFGPQASSTQDTSAHYPGGLKFFDEWADPDGIKYASRLDFLRAMLALSYDSAFITKEHMTSDTSAKLPTSLDPETMVYVARDAHAILPLPRCIFSDCTSRFPEMSFMDDEKSRPSFRSDLSKNPILLSRAAAITIDTILNLTGTKVALENYAVDPPPAQNAPTTPAELLEAQEAGASQARGCLDPRIRGISAMRDPAGFINATYPGAELHALVDDQVTLIEQDPLSYNMSHIPGTPNAGAADGAVPPMVANPNYNPVWRTVPIPVAATTQGARALRNDWLTQIEYFLSPITSGTGSSSASSTVKKGPEHLAATQRLERAQKQMRDFILAYDPSLDILQLYAGLPVVASSLPLATLERTSAIIERQLLTVRRLQDDAERCTGGAAAARAAKLLAPKARQGSYALALRRAIHPDSRTVTVFEIFTCAYNVAGLFFWTAYEMHPRHELITIESILRGAFSGATVTVLDYGVDVGNILQAIHDARREATRLSLPFSHPLLLQSICRVLDTATPTVVPGHFRASADGRPKVETVVTEMLKKDPATADEAFTDKILAAFQDEADLTATIMARSGASLGSNPTVDLPN